MGSAGSGEGRMAARMKFALADRPEPRYTA